eukprot:gene12363-biopygen11169
MADLQYRNDRSLFRGREFPQNSQPLPDTPPRSPWCAAAPPPPRLRGPGGGAEPPRPTSGAKPSPQSRVATRRGTPIAKELPAGARLILPPPLGTAVVREPRRPGRG